MNIRTVSQLNEANEIVDNDLFSISKYNTANNYSSQKITFGTIIKKIDSTIDNKMNKEYSFTKTTVSNLSNNISNNENKIQTLSSDISIINSNINDLTKVTPDWDLYNKTSNFISPNKPGKIVKDKTDNQNKFFVFKFDKDNPSRYTDSQIIPKTGNLFCYGWITAPKVIDPAEAWVGIEAKNKNNDWILISLQPWIVGNNSNVMQYIGFNCPVQQNMEIRVTTGFTITDFSRSFSGRGLILNVQSDVNQSNINNCFIGYVLS